MAALALFCVLCVATAVSGAAQRESPPNSADLLNGVSGKGLPCGPASVAIAFKILGVPIDNQELSALVDRDGTTSFASIVSYAAHRGLFAKAVSLPPSELYRLNNVAILQVREPGRSGGKLEDHFVVSAGPAPLDALNATSESGECLYLFDSVVSSGLRGPFPVTELAEFYTGKALILSKYPIDSAAPAQSVKRVSRIEIGLLLAFGAGILCVMIGALCAARKWRPEPPMRSVAAVAWILALLGMNSAFCGTARGAGADTSPYVVGSTVFNHGPLAVGEVVAHEFELVNPSTSSLTVSLGEKSCTCVSADITGSKTLGPGGHGKVLLTMHVAARGPAAAGVLIHLSGVKVAIRLTISGTASGDSVLLPRMIDFGDVDPKSTAIERPLQIVHRGPKGERFAVLKITSSDGKITAAEVSAPRIKPLADGVVESIYTAVIRLDPLKEVAGPFHGNIVVLCEQDQKRIELRGEFCAHMFGPIETVPSCIVVVSHGASEVTDTSLKIRGRAGADTKIRDVKVSGVKLELWSQEESSRAGTNVLRLRIRPELVGGRASGICTITFATATSGVVDVPIKFIERK
ncbi:MAG TPA: DUF1573 domain-containing protein [Tepidisphaeraceae bacterium]|nr:DUF1573 domain-containing protein [Tepidisphaeraceae bacterium]